MPIHTSTPDVCESSSDRALSVSNNTTSSNPLPPPTVTIEVNGTRTLSNPLPRAGSPNNDGGYLHHEWSAQRRSRPDSGAPLLDMSAGPPLGSVPLPVPSRVGSCMPTRENPFTSPAKWTCYEVCKLIFLSPLMFVRGLLLFILVLLASLVACVAICGTCTHNEHGTRYHTKPMSRCRRLLLAPMPIIIRMMLFLLGFAWIKIVDKRRSKDRPANIVVAAPHLSEVDNLIIYWAFFRILPAVGDASILKVPLINILGLASQSIFVNLRKPQGKAAGKEAIAMRAHPSWEGPPLLVFPEGRITNGCALIQFRTGAFEPQRPVCPVILHYPHKYFDITGQTPSNRGVYCWVFRLLTQFFNSCKVELLDVQEHQPEEDAIMYANRVRSFMAQRLAELRELPHGCSVPVTDDSYDDALFYSKAQDLAIEPSFQVKSSKAFNMENLNSLLDMFGKADRDGDGRISRAEFDGFLVRGFANNWCETDGMRRSRRFRPSHNIFNFFDVDQDDHLDFTEFVQAMTLLSAKGNQNDIIALAFKLVDPDDTGAVSVQALVEKLQPNLGSFALGAPPSFCPISTDLAELGDKKQLPYKEFVTLVETRPDVLKAILRGSKAPILRPAAEASRTVGVYS